METNSSSSSSAPLHKSRVRVLTISPTSPSETHKSLSTPLFFLFVCINFTTTASTYTTRGADFEPLYAKHCNDVVPKSDTHPSKWFLTSLSIQDIGFHSSYFTGGDRLFNQTRKSLDYNKALIFRPNHVARTVTDDIFSVKGTMHLQSVESLLGNSTRRSLRLGNFRGPRVPMRRGIVNFRLEGYYSESSKKLCMIGKSWSMYYAGNFEPSVVLKLNYPKRSSIYDSLITGTLESVVAKDDSNYFDPILMLAFSVKSSYEYTFVGKDKLISFPSSVDRGESIALKNLNDSTRGLCRLLGNRLERYELVYGSDCGGAFVNCDCFSLPKTDHHQNAQRYSKTKLVFWYKSLFSLLK